jgi:hypothetical protein
MTVIFVPVLFVHRRYIANNKFSQIMTLDNTMFLESTIAKKLAIYAPRALQR